MSHQVHELRLNQTQRIGTQSAKAHNRWHPAIPPALRIDDGDEVLLDTLDALDCQIQSTHTVANASNWGLECRPSSHRADLD